MDVVSVGFHMVNELSGKAGVESFTRLCKAQLYTVPYCQKIKSISSDLIHGWSALNLHYTFILVWIVRHRSNIRDYSFENAPFLPSQRRKRSAILSTHGYIKLSFYLLKTVKQRNSLSLLFKAFFERFWECYDKPSVNNKNNKTLYIKTNSTTKYKIRGFSPFLCHTQWSYPAYTTF